MNVNYWVTSLEAAFEDAECYDVLKSIGEDKILEIAETLARSAEVEGEYDGRCNIPDPRDNEVEKLKLKIKELEKTISNNYLMYSTKIAKILKVDPEDVVIYPDRGEVRVEWR